MSVVSTSILDAYSETKSMIGSNSKVVENFDLG